MDPIHPLQTGPYTWEIEKTGAMNACARVFASREMMKHIISDQALHQLVNVAMLPGIVAAAMAMPDIHWGYGFPIGGVAAFDCDAGVISPGGVGYDINCGVRLAATKLHEDDVRPMLDKIADALYAGIPAGVGSTGSIRLNDRELKKVLKQGGMWAARHGFGDETDIIRTEENGCMENADPTAISDRALERGRRQLGTLGSGNHFIELGVVEKIYDPEAAVVYGLSKGCITILLHTGSRGLGHQVCDDFLAKMGKMVHKKGIKLPDRQLACAPVDSPMGRTYYDAMACAANFAWANRQILMHNVFEMLMRTLHKGPQDIGAHLVYDICHNIAKIEDHSVNGEKRRLCVHRKGATRAFPAGHEKVCAPYRQIGQPILIPGDMGTASYVLAGTEKALRDTFGSTCHGAGRVLSRKAAIKAARGRNLSNELLKNGILVRWTGRSTLAEEMPDAYKNIDEVVDVVHKAGISKKVAKLRPIAVIKG